MVLFIEKEWLNIDNISHVLTAAKFIMSTLMMHGYK